PRESAKAAADRKRRQADERNARHRRTRELRSIVAGAEMEAADVERELTEVTERLANPAIYADASAVRDLVERHNALRDLTESLGPELARLRVELSAAEEPELVRSE
ncbi:MAG TPA: hypothetical protein VGP30_01750, partial [Candidatus Limnocylindrales bacterium]|nr:hypothetical protein [Candidatus Limnocylindrales bacterium]